MRTVPTLSDQYVVLSDAETIESTHAPHRRPDVSGEWKTFLVVVVSGLTLGAAGYAFAAGPSVAPDHGRLLLTSTVAAGAHARPLTWTRPATLSSSMGPGYQSGGSVYDSQVPQSARDQLFSSVPAAYGPGGSVYRSQVPRSAGRS